MTPRNTHDSRTRPSLLDEIAQLRARLADAEAELHLLPPEGMSPVRETIHASTETDEEKYRRLFANMAEGFALYELVYDDHGKAVDWRVLEVNDAYTLHTGIPRETIVGRRVGELFPAAIPEYLPRFAQVVASQQPMVFETYSVSVQRYQQVASFPAGPHRFANTITDITGRKTAEIALRDQELKAMALINAADESIFLFSLTGDILAANTTAARRLGATVEELVGKQWHQLIPAELVATRAARVSEAILNKGPVRFEDERMGFYFDHSVYPVRDAQGEITAIAVFSRDITARKEAETTQRQQDEDLKRAQAVGKIGSWRLNIIRNELVWSEENHRIFGIPPGTPLTYESFLATVHPDDRAFVDAQWQSALSGAPYDDIEHRLVIDGEVMWVREKAYLEFAEDGTLLGGFGITQDITRLKQTEEALQRAKAAAEAATRAKSQFLANMSHELRTPMAGVLGMLEHVLAGPLDTQQREFIEIAQTSARSLVRILNDILDLTRIEAGKFSIEEKPFSLRACIENTFNILLPVARKKGIALQCSVDEVLPETLLGDQTRLNQVLTNLAGNAVKFTAAGEVSIRVTAGSKVAGNKTEINFSVSDTGIGIPADKQDRLFHVFSQVDESDSRCYGGTGLGLVISKEIVERMGGTIGFSSEAGRGSVFSFTLPLAIAAPASLWSFPRATPQPAMSPAATPTGPRLLLAEDDSTIRQVLYTLLERSHYAVDLAVNGNEVVALWEKGAYALILMDVQMPGVNGFVATETIRRKEKESGRHIPIIAMTAHALKEDEERCLAAGMDAYLSKPIDFQQSLSLIAELLRRYPA